MTRSKLCSYIFLKFRGESHIDFRTKCIIMMRVSEGWGGGGGGGSITNDVLKFKNFSIKKEVELKIYEINQRLKLWTRVPIAVGPCPAGTHMYW